MDNARQLLWGLARIKGSADSAEQLLWKPTRGKWGTGETPGCNAAARKSAGSKPR